MKKPTGFWQTSLNSLHPSVRVRYLPYFAQAAAMDRSFDAILALWRSANAAAVNTWRALMR